MPSTESIDRREKFLSYKAIHTLEEYALLSQKTMEVTVYRRANQWRPQVAGGSDASVELRSIDLTLPLSQVYEGVSL
jgi:Uma2 family endonuclease